VSGDGVLGWESVVDVVFAVIALGRVVRGKGLVGSLSGYGTANRGRL
jgi:hypothetical protein